MKSTEDSEEQHRFTAFLLVVEQKESAKTDGEKTSSTAGSFQLYGDSLTRFSDRCQNAVEQTSSLPKSDIQVRKENAAEDYLETFHFQNKEQGKSKTIN